MCPLVIVVGVIVIDIDRCRGWFWLIFSCCLFCSCFSNCIEFLCTDAEMNLKSMHYVWPLAGFSHFRHFFSLRIICGNLWLLRVLLLIFDIFSFSYSGYAAYYSRCGPNTIDWYCHLLIPLHGFMWEFILFGRYFYHIFNLFFSFWYFVIDIALFHVEKVRAKIKVSLLKWDSKSKGVARTGCVCQMHSMQCRLNCHK